MIIEEETTPNIIETQFSAPEIIEFESPQVGQMAALKQCDEDQNRQIADIIDVDNRYSFLP